MNVLPVTLCHWRAPNSHPQITLMLPFSEHTWYEESWKCDYTRADHWLLHLPLPPVTFLYASDHPAALSHKYSLNPILEEANLRLGPPPPHVWLSCE